MRPTRLGSARRGQVRLGMGYDPDEPVGEPEEPTDYLTDESARAWYPVSGSGSTSLIQSKTPTFTSGAALSQNLSFDSAVTAGSLLVVVLVARSDAGSSFSGPGDWTQLSSILANGSNGGSGAVFYKIADGTEGTGPFTFVTAGSGVERRVHMAEFGGPNGFVEQAQTDNHASTTSYSIGSVTPTASSATTLLAVALNSQAITSIGSGYTTVSNGFVGSGSNGPGSILAYKAVDPASGSYNATVTQTVSDDLCAGDHIAFSGIADPAWIPAPLTIDDDDATYHEVIGHTECWRGQLRDNYQVGTARLVIGTETAGSRSYDLEGQTLDDIGAGTGTVIGTFSFTATGSYTADTIEIDTSGADGYEFYRLIGPDENRYIYTVNLFSPATGASGGSGYHPDLTGRTTADQHPASAITVTDADGWFIADDAEDVLAELAAKAIGYQGHGSMGSTETFDAAIGSHSGTLTANCTFTLTAAPSGTASTLFLELAQDGTGGWTITLPASVVNRTDIEADQDTTASETTFLALYSRDGGTTWYGGWWSGAASSASFDPGWFNVMDYGATGDGSTDDTSAIQDTIDACVAAGGGTVWFPVGEYVISGALQDTGDFNGQLLLPDVAMTDPGIPIRFLGANRPTFTSPEFSNQSIIRSTLTGASGTAAVISGGNGSYPGTKYNVGVSIENLICISPDNPTMTFWNLGATQAASIRGLLITCVGAETGSYTEPTHSNSYGIKLPQVRNSSYQYIDGLMVALHYTGVLQGELAVVRGLIFGLNKVGVEFPGPGEHASLIVDVHATGCTAVFKATGLHYCDILSYDFETTTGPGWSDIVYDLDDASNYLNGHTRYWGYPNPPTHTFTKNGGTNFSAEVIGPLASGAPASADYLVGTANGSLSAEIVVGTTPGGELGGTWASPTVDGTHSGSAHTDFIAKSIVDAKGDLIAATAADTVARVAVGIDGYVLTAASGATAGVTWAAASASTGIGPILISDTPSTPLIFADLIQNEDQDDLVYADP